jgi:L-fucose isomerase-like protein
MDWKKHIKKVTDTTYLQVEDLVKMALAEERKKVAEEIISIIEGNGYNEWRTRDLKGLYAFTDEGLEQLKQKYIKESK